ncbi:MAG: hypothetical protein ACYC7E_11530 [Armatimonadota bacterium]
MQIASFILINDRILRLFENQLEITLKEISNSSLAFMRVVPVRLQQLGTEHPISIPLSSLYPLDLAAERQHTRVLSTFEDPGHPSRLGQMAEASNVPVYYVSPGRVRDFVRELEGLRLVNQIKPDDVEGLLGRRVSLDELPAVTLLIDQFRHDLYQVYSDAADEGMGVVVLVVNQPDAMTSSEGFPQAA